MKAGAPDIDVGEKIKWWDALDAFEAWPHFSKRRIADGFTRALELMHACRHPDAQWLVSLLPADVDLTRQSVSEALLKNGGGDPRALFLAWRVAVDPGDALVMRAAEMGYAPAQAQVSIRLSHLVNRVEWASRAAEQGDRAGLCQLAYCLDRGWDCEKDAAKAILLFRAAAVFESPQAQFEYGHLAFGKVDWHRFHWSGRAAKRGYAVPGFCSAMAALLPEFEQGKHGRVLFEGAPVIRGDFSDAQSVLDRCCEGWFEDKRFQRIVELYEAMTGRARQAVLCWCVVARRHGVAKDVRLMIAKMAREEVWLWSKTEEEQSDGE
jgi:hypothetical protein